MNELCRHCWWQEGGRCYKEEIATITTVKGFLQGEEINIKLLDRCNNSSSYWNKRKALSIVIPNDKLVITSESK